MDGVSDSFGVERWGIYLLNEQSQLASVDVRGVPDPFVELYEKVGRKVDPILTSIEKDVSQIRSCKSYQNGSKITEYFKLNYGNFRAPYEFD